MIKKAIIFSLIYVVALVALIAYNDDVEIAYINSKTLTNTLTIDPTNELSIVTQYYSNSQFNMSEEELVQYAASKIRIVESETLTNTVEIYAIDVHNKTTENTVIELIDNELTVLSDLGPLSMYKSSTFLTYGQFDANYFIRVPGRVYELHIPKDMQYSFN